VMTLPTSCRRASHCTANRDGARFGRTLDPNTLRTDPDLHRDCSDILYTNTLLPPRSAVTPSSSAPFASPRSADREHEILQCIDLDSASRVHAIMVPKRAPERTTARLRPMGHHPS